MKKILSIGCSGGTSMVCCHKDAEVINTLHTSAEYRSGWIQKPELWEGKVLTKSVITIQDIVAYRDWLMDADIARIFWSSHGTTVKVGNKKEFAFYAGNNQVILFRDFLEGFVLPIYKAKKKKIDIWIDSCFSGKAKRRYTSRDKQILYPAKYETKNIKLKNPKIIRFEKSTAKKELPREMMILTAATGNQSALGELRNRIGSSFVGDTDGCSLWTYNLISAISNAHCWGDWYKKDNWNYVLKLERKRTKAIVKN